MTLDELLRLARLVSEWRSDDRASHAIEIADALLTVFTAHQPCGWEPIAVDLPNQTIELGELELSPDEARWIATELLRGADACEAYRALTSQQTGGK